jgi:hypothetical protein
MHRQIARLLLIWLLVGIFTPLALAISTPAPHECCMRKTLHAQTTHESQFNAPASCCSHDCCRSLTVQQSAHVSPACGEYQFFVVQLRSEPCTASVSSGPVRFESSRAPPQFSIA